MIPPEVMAEHRLAAALAQDRPVTRRAAAVIVLIWVLALAASGWIAFRWSYG
jgi:hypothetical protein